MILTCIVTHDRLALTRRCVESYLATKRPADRLVVVDNASADGTVTYLTSLGVPILLNPRNLYPGAACNQGWDAGLAFCEPDFLHRSDNDILYRPGWGDEVERAFADDSRLVLLGILNLHEDRGEPSFAGVAEPVDELGGNVAMPTAVYRDGLRWSEKPWSPGQAEDATMSAWAARRGVVARLVRSVADNMAFNRAADFPDYYRETAAVRGYNDWERVT